MARKPDYLVRNKRARIVRLDEKAYLIWKQLKQKDKGWNFSKWVSTQLKMEFTNIVEKDVYLQKQMHKEQILFEELSNQHQARMKELRSQLANTLFEEEQKVFKEKELEKV